MAAVFHVGTPAQHGSRVTSLGLEGLPVLGPSRILPAGPAFTAHRTRHALLQSDLPIDLLKPRSCLESADPTMLPVLGLLDQEPRESPAANELARSVGG